MGGRTCENLFRVIVELIAKQDMSKELGDIRKIQFRCREVVNTEVNSEPPPKTLPHEFLSTFELYRIT